MSSRFFSEAKICELLELNQKSPNFYQNQVTKFFEKWPDTFTLLQSKTPNYLSEAAFALHKLKGHGGMLGFIGITEQIETLESLIKECAEDDKNQPLNLKQIDSLQEEIQNLSSIIKNTEIAIWQRLRQD